MSSQRDYEIGQALRATFDGIRSVNASLQGDGTVLIEQEGARREFEPLWAGEGFPSDLRNAGVGPHSISPSSIVFVRRARSGARATLEELGANWMDTVGNAHVEVGGLAVVSGPVISEWQSNLASRDMTKGAGAVAEAVLELYLRGQLAGKRGELPSVSTLAASSVTSSAGVSRALQYFDTMGYTRKTGTERGAGAIRTLDNPSELLSDWAAWYRTRRFPKRSYSSVTVTPESFIEHIERVSSGRVTLTGWKALDEYAPFSTSSPTTTVYVDKSVFSEVASALLRNGELRSVTTGGRFAIVEAEPQVESLGRRSSIGSYLIASPVRLYGDLMRSGARGDDAAEHLREVLIEF